MTQVYMTEDMRGGVTIEDYLRRMDKAGIERSLLIAVRAGDFEVGRATSKSLMITSQSIATNIPIGFQSSPVSIPPAVLSSSKNSTMR